MLVNRVLIAALLAANIACSAETSTPSRALAADNNVSTVQANNCRFSREKITLIGNLPSAKQVDSQKGIDADSNELVQTQSFSYNNGDKVVVEQKFCDMYNLTVSYSLNVLSKSDFQDALDRIDYIVKSVHQDYELKAPLKLVVDMLMNQNRFSINMPFDIAIPGHAAKSKDFVEQNIAFNIVGEAGGQINFYVGLGGE